MTNSSERLLFRAISDDNAPPAAVVGRVQAGNWLSTADHVVVENALTSAEALKACLPHVQLETLSALMPHLPNECRQLVLERFPHADIVGGLARARDMNDDVLGVFVQKGSLMAQREFLQRCRQFDFCHSYTPQQTLRVWNNLMSRYREVPREIPYGWTASEVGPAFAEATEFLSGAVSHLQHGDLLELWRCAELAEVVSDAQRLAWYQYFEVGFGPVEFYNRHSLNLRRDDQFPTLCAEERAAGDVFRFGDTSSIFELPYLTLRTPLAHWLETLLQVSPRRDELFAKCTIEGLQALLSVGQPLDVVLRYSSQPERLFESQYVNTHAADTWDLPEDLILRLKPETAVFIANTHKGAFALSNLVAYLVGMLGGAVDAWRFFWEHFESWEGSIQELADTALAVS